ncbi:MAG: ATP synthase subunit I [Clostridia bacterium]|nr:ATP synthase subunit I [Clostridia bacterium]
MRPDKTVKKETGILLLGTLILCGIMIGIFALAKHFNYTVVTGALLGGLASVFNFFLMGLTVQNAVDKDPAEAKKKIQLSYSLRSFALLVVLGVGVYLPYFHWLAVVLSALFPRVTILFRSMFLKKQDADNGGVSEP